MIDIRAERDYIARNYKGTYKMIALANLKQAEQAIADIEKAYRNSTTMMHEHLIKAGV